MQQNYQWILALVSISLIYSFFYFYIYKQSKHKYIALWGFGWVLYSMGYLVDFFVLITPLSIVLKNLLSIVSSFLLLLGTFEFVGSKYYKIFTSLSVLLTVSILTFSLMLYTADSMKYLSTALSLTASILLCVISVGTGTVFLVHEDEDAESMSGGGKRDVTIDIAAWVFIIWGTHKGFYDFVTPNFNISSWYYISSIFLTNVLNIALILVNSAKSNAEISSSERLYRLLAENSRDLIVKIQLLPQQRYIYISPAVSTISGYDESSFYGNVDFFANIIALPDREKYIEYLKTIQDIDSKIVFRLVRKDGETIWIEQHSTLVRDSRSNSLYVEAILRDVSDRMRIEENLFNSENARRQLMANISHELKNPITSIIGYLSIIDDNLTGTPGKSLKYIKTCLEKSITLNALIQDLFELSKLEARQLRFIFEETNASEYMESVIQRFGDDIERNGAELRVTGLERTLAPLLISIDRRRVDQVFDNAVSNSLNHIGEGGIITFCFNPEDGFSHPEIEKNRDAYVVFSVKDNGVGIPEADLPYVFQRFYRAKSSCNSEGTGLGLTICKEIVSIHKGIIWAESVVNQETTLYFAFPKSTKMGV